MKTKLFFILCFVLSVSLSAQTNHPFIELGKTWADLWHFDNTVSAEIFSTTYYKFGNDVIHFEGKLYYPLFSCFNDSTLTTWTQQQYSYYREDSNKVYVSYGMEPDQLLYDFNLKPGDSILIDQSYGYAHVSRTDSVLLCGSYHKTIYLSYYSPEDTIDTWIEGIGSIYSTFNPLNFHFLTDNTWQLLCVNDTICQLYQNPAFSGCFVSDTIPQAGVETPFADHSFEISPNPVHQSCLVTLKGNGDFHFTVLLLNSQGRIVFAKNLNTNPFIFSREYLPSGFYLMKIIWKDKILSKKVIFN
jgi:hypothetical protein